MNRTPINPSEWGLAFSMNQAEVVEGLTRHVHFSGQVALEADATAEMGIRVVHAGRLFDGSATVQATAEELDVGVPELSIGYKAQG